MIGSVTRNLKLFLTYYVSCLCICANLLKHLILENKEVGKGRARGESESESESESLELEGAAEGEGREGGGGGGGKEGGSLQGVKDLLVLSCYRFSCVPAVLQQLQWCCSTGAALQ